MKKRTDLAVELRESIPEDSEEVKGVILEKETFLDGGGEMSLVVIKNEKGSKAMGRPMGTYITLEQEGDWEQENDVMVAPLQVAFQKLGLLRSCKTICVVGLGNQKVTSDALGPKVVSSLLVTRHLERELGKKFMEDNQYGNVCALAPGVMAQTGMDTYEIVQTLIHIIHPDCMVFVDALASRRVNRLGRTIQITDAGISPGSGVGNHRKELSRKTLGVPVIAVGVPTVVDTGTIVMDHMEEVLQQQGYTESEINAFVEQIIGKDIENVFVTPKNVDELIEIRSKDIAKALNGLIHNCSPFFI